MMLHSLKKSINQKVPLNRAIISDILLWIALSALLAYGVYLLVIALPAQRRQTIQLEFLNANEISRGAPVRLMGTAIGFVDDIRIEEDHVRVTVQTDPGAVKIPSGSVFTILFTGLGGAKSIEINLPSKPVREVDGKPLYLVKEPISMRDTLNASLDSVQALQKGSENISDFFGKRKPVEELQFNIQQALKMSGVASRNTLALSEGLGSISQDIKTYSQLGVDTIQSFNHGAKIMNQSTQPAQIRSRIMVASNNVQNFHDAFVSQGRLATQVPNRLNKLSGLNTQISVKLGTLNQKLAAWAIPQWLDDFEKGQTNYQMVLHRMTTFFEHDYAAEMEQTRCNIQQFNQQLILWNAKACEWERQGLLKPKSPPTPTSSKSFQRLTTPNALQSKRLRDQAQSQELAGRHQPRQTNFQTQLQLKPSFNHNSIESNPINPVISIFQTIGDMIAFLFS
jgi:ABC-type transporter Mla subunit MlaD